MIHATAFVSRTLSLGEIPPRFWNLLGHNKTDATAGAAHPARDSITASSARVADSIASDPSDEESVRRSPGMV